MRLSKIKLSGFKSFVDPTSITFPSNLVGVVGPNGCGKSNVIDAVRWVMGESSASRLRGDSITDVIFKGSSSRKPIGAASVELLFDNSSSTIKGEYSKYNEISIRRAVSRDGVSNYYLNGVRCRRKDITGIFLGTGLGPRSYSIIEQGMISRVIEAKPEEMRIFLEEAAGISKYKERRKETSTRINRTKENLDRLLDVIEEVDKQIKHLNRQAKTAERYKKMRHDERQLSANILALRIRNLESEKDLLNKLYTKKELTLESEVTEQRKIESNIENLRLDQSDKNDKFSEIQAQYYKIGSEISRLEQSIEYTNEIQERQKRDLENAISNEEEIQSIISQDKKKITNIESSLEELTPDIERVKISETSSKESYQEADDSLKRWQSNWEAENIKNNELQKDISIESNQLENLQNRLKNLKVNEKEIDEEIFSTDREALKQEIESANIKFNESYVLLDDLKSEIEERSNEIRDLREVENNLTIEINRKKKDLNEFESEHIKLIAMQDSSYNSSDNLNSWLKKNNFKKNKRIINDISVSEGWQTAVETVLGDYLGGIKIDSIQRAMDVSSSLKSGQVTFFNDINNEKNSSRSNTLAEKVSNAPDAIYSILGNVFLSDSIDNAINMTDMLNAGESVIIKNGIWISKDWVRISRGLDAEKDNAISREKQIQELDSKLKNLKINFDKDESSLSSAKNDLSIANKDRDRLQERLPSLLSENVDIKNLKENLVMQLERLEKNVIEGKISIDAIGIEISSLEKRIIEVSSLIEEYKKELVESNKQLNELNIQKTDIENELSRVRDQYEEDRTRYQEMQIQFEGKLTSKESASQNLERMQSQKMLFQSRKNEILEQIELNKQPLIDNKKLLEEQLHVKVDVEEKLNEARKLLDEVDSNINLQDQSRMEVERKIDKAKTSLAETKGDLQEIQGRKEGINEQLSQTNFTYEELIDNLDESESLEDMNQNLEKLTNKINRLGPINLAAIDELESNTERKEYLDSQLEDLNSALSTLEGAIRKIDTETRSRFRETFNKVNFGFESLFPKLFGGGQAYMELIGNDLLTAGVTVMARPPGKRNSSINLLSGGEKALTAVALVFAIFELNPSPFCMLDEVDAPLDDTNVNRFCEIVDEMSKKVQFIFITHNKITMEMAKQLSGVTMQEPGVSRLVSVDIDEAIKLSET
ncbi:MAG: chromosome segregation protein SMC [Woeseiaceae bacterium]|nr:chromosome segregation protein SMC [Woeseiaceae bacterium]